MLLGDAGEGEGGLLRGSDLGGARGGVLRVAVPLGELVRAELRDRRRLCAEARRGRFELPPELLEGARALVAQGPGRGGVARGLLALRLDRLLEVPGERSLELGPPRAEDAREIGDRTRVPL